MDYTIAFTIIGWVLGFVGIIFNLIPKQINNKLMGNLGEEATQIATEFRVILSSLGIIMCILTLSYVLWPYLVEIFHLVKYRHYFML